MIRKMEGIVFSVHEKQIVQFLRDAVLLLHGLSQKDKLFHEHCLEVLHQYDGVLSGVTAVLRKGQHLKACEGETPCIKHVTASIDGDLPPASA